MSPRRPLRPEDLKPSDHKPIHSEDGYNDIQDVGGGPAGDGPDPPDIASMEEHMVPALSLSGYLALATALLTILGRLRSERFIAELMGLAIFGLPFALGAFTGGMFGDANNPVMMDVPNNGAAIHIPSPDILMIALLGGIFGTLIWLVLKSMLDARGYSLLRHTVSGTDSPKHPGTKKTLGFFAANLVQLGLAMGAGMGMAPVIMRMAKRTLVTHQLSIFVGLILPIFIAMLLYTWLRVLCMYITAWMTWRPTFVAGALGAAFAAPVRSARAFWSSYAFLLPLLTASVLIITLCICGMYLPSITIAIPRMLLEFCLIGTAFIFIQSLIWFDVAIAGSIGHQIGEFSIARTHEEAVRMRTAALEANLGTMDQQRIPAAPSGLYHIDNDIPRHPIAFSEVLQLVAMHHDDAPTAPDNEKPTDETSQTHDPPSKRESATTSAEEPPKPPQWIAPAIEDDGSGTVGLARLTPSLLPMTLRTHNGQPERRYNGHHKPRQGHPAEH